MKLNNLNKKLTLCLTQGLVVITNELNSHKKEVEQLIEKAVDSQAGIESIERKLEEYKKYYNLTLLSKAF